MLSTKVPLMQLIHRNVIHLAFRNCSSVNKDIKRQANTEQLYNVYTQLSHSLPSFFTSTHCFNLYNPQIIFEDNIRNVSTQGINAYVKQISFIKFMAHLRYSHVKMNILKITQHPEDSTVRVRWRVVGLPGLRIIFLFWNYRLWDWNKLFTNQKSDWIDGFSVFHVGNDGLIHKHVCEKIMPDEERTQVKDNTNIGVKLALILGLAPHSVEEELFDEFVSLVSRLLPFIEMSTKVGPFG